MQNLVILYASVYFHEKYISIYQQTNKKIIVTKRVDTGFSFVVKFKSKLRVISLLFTLMSSRDSQLKKTVRIPRFIFDFISATQDIKLFNCQLLIQLTAN